MPEDHFSLASFSDGVGGAGEGGAGHFGVGFFSSALLCVASRYFPFLEMGVVLPLVSLFFLLLFFPSALELLEVFAVSFFFACGGTVVFVS